MDEQGKQPNNCYVLFDGYTDALALFDGLKQRGVGVRISPTPRMARSECGTALLFDCADKERIACIVRDEGFRIQSIVELPAQINPQRDRYC